jgi:DNA repair protein RadC
MASEPTDTDVALLLLAGVSERAAKNLIANLGDTLSSATKTELIAAGVPEKTATKLSAAMALGRRSVSRAGEKRAPATRPEDIWHLMRDRALDLQQEVFWTVAIDIRNQIVGVFEVARGSVHGVEVHPREIFRQLIRCAAAGAVLVHNHPSGDPTPSEQDVELTRRLRTVADVVGIPVIDHVVITPTSFRSIAEIYRGDL